MGGAGSSGRLHSSVIGQCFTSWYSAGRSLNQASTSRATPAMTRAVPKALAGQLSSPSARIESHHGLFCGRYAGVSEPTNNRAEPNSPRRTGAYSQARAMSAR